MNKIDHNQKIKIGKWIFHSFQLIAGLFPINDIKIGKNLKFEFSFDSAHSVSFIQRWLLLQGGGSAFPKLGKIQIIYILLYDIDQIS